MSAISDALAKAARALSQRRPDDAVAEALHALRADPSSLDARFLLGVAHVMRGASGEAIPLLREVAHVRRNNADVEAYLGCALQDAGANAEAVLHLHTACRLAPERAANWYNLGKALKDDGQLDAAADALRHALDRNPQHLLAQTALADIDTMQGRIGQAVAGYRHVLQRDPANAIAWHALANLKTVALSADDARQIRSALQGCGDARSRAALGFSLYKALEDQHDYAGAFVALQAANAEMRAIEPWDVAAEHAHIVAIEQAFASPVAGADDPALGSEVIFIVSLPRSGSTLVEQILASHPQVEGANEIDDLPQVIDGESRRRGKPFPAWVREATSADWSRLGREYLARTAKWRAHKPRFTDKGLTNWPLVGTVLAMLPAAHVVSCHRDALETCFACYRQLFRHGMGFSYDLGNMVDRYLDYRRLSGQWTTCHAANVMELDYNALAAAPEPGIRQLLTRCRLPFDPACLSPQMTQRAVSSTASAAQVRLPIAPTCSSVVHYQPWLDAATSQLGNRR